VKKTIIMVFERKSKNLSIDIEVPLNISANELLYGLNQGLCLGLDLSRPEDCYLVTENPIALLRGNKSLADYGLHDGTVIFFNR